MAAESLIATTDPLWGVLIRLVAHIAVLIIIVGFIYKRFSTKKGYMFSFYLMGIIIFLVCVVLKGIELHIGMAFGLFALFSIVRFRTRNIEVKEMSYFFTIMGVAAINALIEFPHPIRGAVLINSIVILTIFILELAYHKVDATIDKKELKKALAKNSLSQTMVQYNNLELLNPAKIQDLISDIALKTGINAEKIEIKRIDLNTGTAELDVSYRNKSFQVYDDELHITNT